jgi:hypothetical protein
LLGDPPSSRRWTFWLATANGITCYNENNEKKKQLGELQGKAWVIHVTVAKLVKKN